MDIQNVEQYYSRPSDVVLNSSEEHNQPVQNESTQNQIEPLKTQNPEKSSIHSVDFLV